MKVQALQEARQRSNLQKHRTGDLKWAEGELKQIEASSRSIGMICGVLGIEMLKDYDGVLRCYC